MSTISIPQNGLPQEVASIPFGQVIVLTNPELGITAKHITIMEAIFKLATICGQGHIINTRSVQDSGLWDCYACKIMTDKGVQILISDKDSLFEMLCEFWGLDYEEVSKSIVLDGRSKYIPIDGESHPVRVTLAVSKDKEKADYGFKLQLIQEHTKANELLDIRRALQNSFYHKLDISVEEIIDLYEDVKKNLKTYHLDINIEKDQSGKISSCDISLKDNFGKLYPLKQIEDKKEKHLEPQLMAFYLTFILYKEGKRPNAVQDDDFYETLLKIQSQLPYRFRKPQKDNLVWNVHSKKSVIRKSIWDATHDSYAQEQFSIDGYSEDLFRVAGATDEDREKIKKEFGLE